MSRLEGEWEEDKGGHGEGAACTMEERVEVNLVRAPSSLFYLVYLVLQFPSADQRASLSSKTEP